MILTPEQIQSFRHILSAGQRLTPEAAAALCDSHEELRAKVDADECEGCGDPATHEDVNGVGLCKECYDECAANCAALSAETGGTV